MGGGGWGRGYQLMGVPRPPGHDGKGITPRTDVGISDRSVDTVGLLLPKRPIEACGVVAAY